MQSIANQKFKCLSFLILLFGLSGFSVNALSQQLADYAYNRIDRIMVNKEIAIVTAPHGMPVSKLEAGKEYHLVVKTSHQAKVRNKIIFYFARTEQSHAKNRYIELLIQPELGHWDWITTARLDGDYEVIPFKIPESTNAHMNGRFEAVVAYLDANRRTQNAVAYWELKDQRPHQAMAQNPDGVFRTYAVNVGFMGSGFTPEQQQEIVEDLEERFIRATKGYINISVNIIGQQSFPENGTLLANSEHDYIGWWNSVPKIENDPDYRPLDPQNAEDLEKIQLAWYEAHPRQMVPDMNALFGLDDDDYEQTKYLFYIEAGYRFAGSRYAAYSSVLSNYGNEAFTKRINGEVHYGFNEDHLFWQPESVTQKIALHELGHTFGFEHPHYEYLMSGDHWQVKISHATHESITNIMTQGTIGTTNIYYLDEDIRHIMPVNRRIGLQTLSFVDYNPVPHNLSTPILEINGDEDQADAVSVNGLPAQQNATDWTATVQLNEGENFIDIARTQNGLTGQPQRVKVDYEIAQLPEPPDFSMEVINRGVGAFSEVTLRSASSRGIKSSWYWVYKIENGNRLFKLNLGRWANHQGEHQSEVNFRLILQEGEYEICGRARDMLYGTGTQSQSAIQCEVVVL